MEDSSSANFPSITPETINNKEALLEFIPLAEMVARKEMGNLPPHLADFKELVNIGLIKIDALINDSAKKRQTYNPSYIIQGIIWEIKNKNRKESYQRGEFRYSSTVNTEDAGYSLQDIQEAVLETVISYDEKALEVAAPESGNDPAEQLEVEEMREAVRKAIALLPDHYRQVIELRFYQGRKCIDIASQLGISSTRVTRIIQDSITQIRERLTEKRFI